MLDMGRGRGPSEANQRVQDLGVFSVGVQAHAITSAQRFERARVPQYVLPTQLARGREAEALQGGPRKGRPAVLEVGDEPQPQSYSPTATKRQSSSSSWASLTSTAKGSALSCLVMGLVMK